MTVIGYANLSELIKTDEEVEELFNLYPTLPSIVEITATDYPMDINFIRESCMIQALDDARKLRKLFDFIGLDKWVLKYEAEIMSRFNNTELQQEFYLLKGISLANDKQRREQAFEYFNKALNFPIKKTYMTVQIYKELGNLYRFVESYEQSEECYQKALELLNDGASTRSNLYIELTHNLAALYINLERYKLADKKVNDALDWGKGNNDSYLADALYRLKARISIATKNIEAGSFYLQKAKVLNEYSDYYGLASYIQNEVLMIELSKAGVCSHEGEALTRVDKEALPEIYDFYMSQPKIQEAYIAYETNNLKQKMQHFKQKL